jgi:predicted glutamine amidotransferase
MIAVIARKPVAARPFLHELALQSRTGADAPHGDGFGAGIFTGGHWLHVREQCPAWDVSLAALAIIEGTLMLLHSRKASDPATVNLTKLHPFCRAGAGPGVMFCQNGTIRQHERMRTRLDASAIDTEKYFDVVLRHYETRGDFGKAFLVAAEEIKNSGADPTSLNALISDGKELVAYKGEILAENCCYHTLLVKEEADISIVSTEPFQGEEEGKWRPLHGIFRKVYS